MGAPMKPWPTKHFTAEDLDAFHSEALSEEMRLHLETCDECQRLVASDQVVLKGLRALPGFAPRPGFENRVMARIRIPATGRVPLLSFPKLRRRELTLAASIALAVLVSALWSATHRTVLDGWIEAARSQLWGTLWLGIRGLAANLVEQPWFAWVRETLAAPTRAAATIGVGLAGYLAGLLALRRLVTPSSPAVPDGNF